MKKTTMCYPILKHCTAAVLNKGHDAVNQLWLLLHKSKAILKENVLCYLVDKSILEEDFVKTTQWRELGLEAILCDLCGYVWEGV